MEPHWNALMRIAISKCARFTYFRNVHFFCLIKEVQKIGGFNSSYSEKDRKSIWELKFDYSEFVKKVESDYIPDVG